MMTKGSFLGIRFAALILAAATACSGRASELSIADSIIRYTALLIGRELYSATLFRADGTWQDLTDESTGATFPYPYPAGVLRHGTYTFTPDATDTQRGVLVMHFLDLGVDTTEHLVFGTSREGYVEVPEYPHVRFTVFPRLTTDSLRNVSNRAWATSERVSITGFIVDGDDPRWVLIRAAGPSLEDFGVPTVLRRPRFTLFRGPVAWASVSSWSGPPFGQQDGLRAAFEIVGAFPFADDSSDAARLFLLMPGAYSVHASGENENGEVLTEVYLLPY